MHEGGGWFPSPPALRQLGPPPSAYSLPDPAPPSLRLRAAARPRDLTAVRPGEDRLPRARVPGLPGWGRSRGAPRLPLRAGWGRGS